MTRRPRYFQRHHARSLARRGDAVKGDRVSPRPVGELLATLNHPARLRILNTVSRVPLSVSDLASILGMPEADVAASNEELQDLRIVRAFTVVPHVLYTLAPLSTHHEQLLRAALDAVRNYPEAQRDRAAARQRSRVELATRARPALMDAT